MPIKWTFPLSAPKHESIDAGWLYQRKPFVEDRKATQFERCTRGAVIGARLCDFQLGRGLISAKP